MKKLFFIFAIACIIFGCSDNPSSPLICERKNLYYEDVTSTRYKDQYYTQWLDGACVSHYEAGMVTVQTELGDCSYWDRKYYITIEECGDIYIKE